MFASGDSNSLHVSRRLIEAVLPLCLDWNTILLEYMYERLMLKDFPLIVLEL